MATLTASYRTGATSTNAGLTVTDPKRSVTEEQLDSLVDIGGMNVPFMFGTMSQFLAHERCGRHLYRSVAARTRNAELKSKYEEFGAETETHVEKLEQLITAMGGDPQYVSPAARAIERADTGTLESTFLLQGSVDSVTTEAVMLTAVMVAESVDQANWRLLSALAQSLPHGDVRALMMEVTDEVLAQEHEHFSWARDTRQQMAMLQAQSDADPSL